MCTSIGTLNEGHLHASLKARYVEAGDIVEAAMDGYVIDILRGEGIIEIQTANFSAIARKMRDLASRRRVRLVHPIARDRWIVKPPRTKRDGMTRRKSPKHADVIDVFEELVSFPELIAHENFELEVVLTQEEEVLRFDNLRRWRRRGWVTVERRLVAVAGTVTLRDRADYAALLPAGLAERFVTAEMAAALGRPRALAQKMAYCLRKGGIIKQVGTSGNAIVYARSAI